MLTLRLPDGAIREVPEGALPRDLVASIGPRLLRDAIAVKVDGEVQDLNTPLRKGGDFKVLTEKDPESLAVLRHSARDHHCLVCLFLGIHPAGELDDSSFDTRDVDRALAQRRVVAECFEDSFIELL